uniref:Uncharacterized protein n=1 Tax=Anguilla anguilla TaxID=7936 RepID=A0A0E9VTM0_ANGAN
MYCMYVYFVYTYLCVLGKVHNVSRKQESFKSQEHVCQVWSVTGESPAHSLQS